MGRIKRIWESAKNWFINIGNKIFDGLTAPFRNITKVLQEAWNKASNIFSKPFNVKASVVTENQRPNSFKVPALAEGGLMYRPKLVEVGEYAGASHDPEVISPLSAMKNAFLEALQGFKPETSPQTIDLTINLGGENVGREIINLINRVQREAGKTLVEI